MKGEKKWGKGSKAKWEEETVRGQRKKNGRGKEGERREKGVKKKDWGSKCMASIQQRGDVNLHSFRSHLF